MATLQELRGLFNDSDLLEKGEAALIIEAKGLLAATPTAADKAWAASVTEDTNAEAQKALKFVLASNSDASVATIQGATDNAIQTSVNSVVSALVDAMAGV